MRRSVLATLAVAVLAIAGVARFAATRDEEHFTPDVEAFASLIGAGTNSSYGFVASPRALAESADLVVEGHIRDVRGGPILDAARTPTFVVAVVVSTIHKGSLPTGSEGIVYVEFWASTTAETYDQYAPRDATVLLYLYPAATLVELGPMLNPEAGRPVGQPLWEPSPLGFYLHTDGGPVVKAGNEALEFGNTDLNEFLPDRDHWPDPLGRPATPDEDTVPTD